jgi:hypothetical protein
MVESGSDPGGGGVSIYSFTGNGLVNHVDVLGLGINDPPSSATSPMPCCNGVTFDASKKCCCNNKEILDRAPVDSGVSLHSWEGDPDPNAYGQTPIHEWITWNENEFLGTYESIDSNGRNNRKVSYPAIGPPAGGWERAPSSVKLSPCEYNIKAFNKCLSDYGELSTKSDCVGGLCDEFVEDLVESCMKASKGCGSSE